MVWLLEALHDRPRLRSPVTTPGKYRREMGRDYAAVDG